MISIAVTARDARKRRAAISPARSPPTLRTTKEPVETIRSNSQAPRSARRTSPNSPIPSRCIIDTPSPTISRSMNASATLDLAEMCEYRSSRSRGGIIERRAAGHPRRGAGIQATKRPLWRISRRIWTGAAQGMFPFVLDMYGPGRIAGAIAAPDRSLLDACQYFDSPYAWHRRFRIPGFQRPYFREYNTSGKPKTRLLLLFASSLIIYQRRSRQFGGYLRFTLPVPLRPAPILTQAGYSWVQTAVPFMLVDPPSIVIVR